MSEAPPSVPPEPELKAHKRKGTDASAASVPGRPPVPPPPPEGAVRSPTASISELALSRSEIENKSLVGVSASSLGATFASEAVRGRPSDVLATGTSMVATHGSAVGMQREASKSTSLGDLPVLPPAPLAPALRLVYIVKCSPGVGFRRSARWDDKVEGEGLKEGERFEGEERVESWVFVPSKSLWLPIRYGDSTLIQVDKDSKRNRDDLMKHIKRRGGRKKSQDVRARLLGEISKGANLKRAALPDVGRLVIGASDMHAAIDAGLVSHSVAQELWRFLSKRCPKSATRTLAESPRSRAVRAQTEWSKERLYALVRAMKVAVPPKTVTFVKKKYLNAISGAQILYFLSDCKESAGDDHDAIGELLLRGGLLVSASKKRAKREDSKVRVDQYYRYGSIPLLEGYLERMNKHMFNSSFKKRYYRLLEAPAEGKSKRQQYSLVSYTKEGDASPHTVINISDAKLNPIPRLALEFVLKFGARETRFRARNPTEKKLWVEKFKEVLGARGMLEKPPPTFGAKLDAVTKSVQNVQVPKVVWDCVEYVRKFGMETDGVFRKSGSNDRIKDMKTCYDSDTPVGFRDGDDVHNAAGCLKLWLREMPEPLVPYDFYRAFTEAKTEDDLRVLVKKIPKDNQYVLAYLCDFLRELSLNHAKTRMTIKNLSIVFAPNILQPKDETPLQSLDNNPVKVIVFSKMIEKAEAIYNLPSKKKEAIQFI